MSKMMDLNYSFYHENSVNRFFRNPRNLHNRVGIRTARAYGGEKNIKLRRFKDLPHVVIACPGRIHDFLRSRVISIRNCHALVLDEADRMLDMGFKNELQSVIGFCHRNDEIRHVCFRQLGREMYKGWHRSTCGIRKIRNRFSFGRIFS